MDEMERTQPFHLEFQVTADEVFAALNKVDVLSGAARKNRAFFGMLLIIVALYVISFFTERKGIALVLAGVFAMLALYVRRRALKGNYQLAKAFEADEKQVLDAAWTQLVLGERTVGYSDVVALYQFKESYTFRYMGNHYYVIPKRVFAEGQEADFLSMMQAQLGDKYTDHSYKL